MSQVVAGSYHNSVTLQMEAEYVPKRQIKLILYQDGIYPECRVGGPLNFVRQLLAFVSAQF
jgi:hypothetical protein